MKNKHIYWVLGAAYLSFFALGLPDGAFAIAWPFVREDMGFPLELAGVILVGSSAAYALAGILLGRISGLIESEKIAFLGGIVLMAGLLARVIIPNFAFLVFTTILAGFGGGLIDASINAYMAQSFSARYINWLHCFWGLGAAVGPILFTQLVLISGWRLGYFALGAIQGLVVVVLLVSILKAAWLKREAAQELAAQAEHKEIKRANLTEKRHQVIEILICFFQGGAEFSMGFWVATVMLESRGLTPAAAGLFPAAFYGAVMGGRLVFGYLADRLSDITIIRIGMVLGLAGTVMLIFSSSLFGMALVGLGFAPIFPCLLHDCARRFGPQIVTRLIGYQVAAFSMGVAILTSLKGTIMAGTSLEALFPMVLVLAAAAFLLNEWLERIAQKNAGNLTDEGSH
ncbi:MAG: MFS transporter [Oscillospiraceae bacterium]|nr:MFS transporter [Oscillospiraceae bacterium]